MKRIRFGSALLFLALSLAFALASGPISSAEEEGKKCSCYYPNSQQYGVRSGDDCVVQDCFIILD